MLPNPAETTPTLLTRLHRFGVDNGGATAVIAAILFPVVVGGLGLGAEIGYWYLTQRKLQHAVDLSVHAAGARLRADDPDAKIEAAALYVATQSGYSPGTLTVDPHYTSTAYPDEKLVEVVATETRPRMFSAVVAGFFSSEPTTEVTLSARAVAMVDGSEGTVACVLALSPTAPRGVVMDGSSSVNLEGCDIASNSNKTESLYATSTVFTDCAYSVGGAHTPGLTSNVCENVKVNQPLIRDPYAEVDEPIPFGSCGNKNVGTPGAVTKLPAPTDNHPSGVKSKCFSGGLNIKGEVHFEPGLYIIDGGTFTLNGGIFDSNSPATIVGNGVTFLFINDARAELTGNVTLNLAAPGDGPHSGILFFGSRDDSVTHKFGGTSDPIMNGAIYAPTSNIAIRGNSKAVGGCTQVIGNTVTFTGASTMKSDCENAGTSDIVTNETVKIVE